MKLMLRILCSVLLLTGTMQAFAQKSLSGEALAKMKLQEDTLVKIADSLYADMMDEDRIEACYHFIKQLKTALKEENSFAYDFPQLQKKINIMYPKDKSFRLMNWEVKFANTVRRYYGVIQANSKDMVLFPLVDYSPNIEKGIEDSVLTAGKWMGCQYYNMIEQDINGRPMYFLFGINRTGILSNKKLVDVLYFSQGKPVFGAPLFVPNEREPYKTVTRFVLEYKKDATPTLNFDPEMNMIIFDKMASEIGDKNRKYSYVPVGDYEGMRFEGGRWIHQSQVVQIMELQNGQAPTEKPFNFNTDIK